jgi:hypothetical protein
LGNVENIDATLNNIWSTFKAGDIGIFSVAKIPTEADAQKLIEPYRSKQFALAAAQPLVSIGIPVENLDFRVEWNSAFNYIEGIHTIKRTHRIAVRGDDRNFIELISGHEVRTFLSRRFDVDTISGHLERSGYRILKSMDVRAEGALHLLVDVAGG